MSTLTKAHGSENQFFILDQTLLENPLNDGELSQLAIQLCDPDHHVLGGADGVLVVNTTDHPDCLGEMRIINADGSEAKMCGNGLRTVTRYLAEKFHQTKFKVATPFMDLAVEQAPALAPKVPAYSVQIAPISMAAQDLPLHYHDQPVLDNQLVPEFLPEQRFTAIAVPNPHLISFVDQIDQADLGQLGQGLNATNPYFTEGVNVSFAVIEGPNQLFVQTYERGVGFTNACGTGMSATSLAFARQFTDQFDPAHPITVRNPGGLVQVRVVLGATAATSQLHLIGNATFTAKLDLPEADLHHAVLNQITVRPTDEEMAYQAFVQAANDHAASSEN